MDDYGRLPQKMQNTNHDSRSSEFPTSIDVDSADQYVLTEGLIISDLDVSGDVRAFLVTVRNHRFQVNQLCLDALRFFSKPHTFHEFHHYLARRAGSPLPESENSDVLRQLIVHGFIQPLYGTAHEVERSGSTRLKFKTELFSRAQLEPLTTILGKLYEWPALVICGLIVVISHTLVFLQASPINIGGVGSWWILVPIVYISLAFHELGHLSACRHYGIKHGGLGFGLLFIYPVLYADVSDCWSLTRYQRAVVDVSGIAFQLLFGSSIAVLALISGNSLVVGAVNGVVFCALINLNPFFRLDGYWLVNDILGITSLDRLRNELFAHAYKRMRGRDATRPAVFAYPHWMITIVAIYGLGSCLFVAFIIYILYSSVPKTFSILYAKVDLMFKGSITQTLDLLIAVLFALFAFLIVLRMALRILSRFLPRTLLRRFFGD